MKKRGYREERDVLGKVSVPASAYYGAFTARAFHNFQLSGQRAPHSFIKSLGLIKKAAALTNYHLKLLEGKKMHAIVRATDEVVHGKFDDSFVVDIYQAGAGTPYNMNCNEVIANRATEFLGGKRGKYTVHPNDAVNMSQSSNDVIPTAMRLSILFDTPHLVKELQTLEKTLRAKAGQFRNVLKMGRTHLQDAVPMTLRQEFTAYADILQGSIRALTAATTRLHEIPLGGTAIGTGINTHPHYQKKVVQELKKITHLPLVAAKDPIALTQNMDAFVAYSNALKMIAVDIITLSNNLVLLNSGPRTGISEIELPAVEAGSSIMPGKINPSIFEAATMVSYRVIGNDHMITYAALHTTLELNVMTPLIIHTLLESIQLLTHAVHMLHTKCIQGITAHKEHARALLEGSVAYATALTPYLGYAAVSALVKEAVKKCLSLREVILRYRLMEKRDLEALLSLPHLTRPRKLNVAILSRVQVNPHYKKYLQNLRR